VCMRSQITLSHVSSSMLSPCRSLSPCSCQRPTPAQHHSICARILFISNSRSRNCVCPSQKTRPWQPTGLHPHTNTLRWADANVQAESSKCSRREMARLERTTECQCGRSASHNIGRGAYPEMPLVDKNSKCLAYDWPVRSNPI